jgi:ribosome biogenesis GTPase
VQEYPLDKTNDQTFDIGTVYRKTVGGYSVKVSGGIIECALSAKLRLRHDSGKPESASKTYPSRKARPTKRIDPVVVGDRVQFIDARDGSGMIFEVLPRRSWLSRRSAVPMPSARPYEQVIAANVDQVVPVMAASQPDPKWGLLDRYLVTAESAGLPAVICITKLDLVQDRGGETDHRLLESLQVYRNIGYPVALTSVRTGQGLNQAKQTLRGLTSVLLGKSGVGKTSLLNALQPALELTVGEVNRKTGIGKHITTFLEMYDLEFGGALVDTPGMREFGLWDVDWRELPYLFPEMRAYHGRCKFGLDCRHDREPGCEIRKAVSAGRISPYRYQSYMRLMDEVL